MSFCPRISTWETRNSQNWNSQHYNGHNFLCIPLIEVRLRENLYPSLTVFQYMWHATYMHVFNVDSRLLMVQNQIDTLTLDLSFGHNLCFKYSNGSCEPILNIRISRTFQWYKK